MIWKHMRNGKQNRQNITGKINMKGKKEDKEKRKASQIGTAVVLGKHVYEGNIATKAIKRAGKNKNLKGHVFELLTVDKENRKLSNILTGKKAVLTNSSTATRDDVLIKQGGKVVKRMQMKDTPGGIKDTVARVTNKQYAGTNLVGTKETARAYAQEVAKKNAKGVKVTQKMATNGISSQQTELIAEKVLGGSVSKSASKIAGQASKTGMKTAMFSAATGAAVNAGKVARGEISAKTAIGHVAKDTATNAVASAVGDAVATGVTIAIASTPAAPVAIPAGTAAGVGAAVVTDKIIRNTDFSKVAGNVKKSGKKT